MVPVIVSRPGNSNSLFYNKSRFYLPRMSSLGPNREKKAYDIDNVGNIMFYFS